MRALANMGIPQGDQRKVWYLGPMFRGERPAAGRKRQFHQIGLECVGTVGPGIDVESIAILQHLLDELDITSTKLLLNSRGTAEDRQVIGDTLREFFGQYRKEFCEDCQRRLETNVWRILDCKQERCGQLAVAAPEIPDLLSDTSKAYFDAVCQGLTDIGLSFEVDPRLVRGLDYYAHTVFEVAFDGIGAQNALAGGGRYVITPPGCNKPLEGIGFAAGIERLLLAQDELGVADPEAMTPDVYLVGLGADAQRENAKLAQALRRQGIAVGIDCLGRGVKPQMRAANRSGTRYCVIRGENELADGIGQLRDMRDGEQREIKIDELGGILGAG
jgi:histidyl-tRNA synthetase